MSSDSDEMMDEEFQARFAAQLVKYGTLWRSLRHKERQAQPPACTDECCQPSNSFVPVEYLNNTNDNVPINEADSNEDDSEEEDSDEESEEDEISSSDDDEYSSGTSTVVQDKTRLNRKTPLPKADMNEQENTPAVAVEWNNDPLMMQQQECRSPIFDDGPSVAGFEGDNDSISSDDDEEETTSSSSDDGGGLDDLWTESPVYATNEASESISFAFKEEEQAPSNSAAPPTAKQVEVVDLLSSSSSEDESRDAPTPPKQGLDSIRSEARFNLDSSTTESEKESPPTRTARSKHIQIEESSSSSEAEWKDDSPDKEEIDDSSVLQLTERTNQMVILSSDDESSEDASLRKPQRPLRRKKSQTTASKSSKAVFRRNREAIAKDIFAKFDQAAFGGRLESTTTLSWSNKLRTTAGMTRMRKTSRPGFYETKSAVLELSTKIIDQPSRLRSTLLHEMCHAAAWVIDGVSKPPHGKCFQKWAKLAMAQVPDVIVTTTHNYEIEFRYAWACTTPKCGVVIKRHSRSVDVYKHVCGRCKGKLMEIEVTTGGAGTMKPRKKAAPSAYNIFVKENSGPVREKLVKANGNNNVTQSQVLQECARLWREKNQTG